MKNIIRLISILIFTLTLSSAAQAQLFGPKPLFEGYTTFGVARITANEYVYNGSWTTSKLTWETTSPLLSSGFKARMPDNWIVKANVDASISGNSNMIDLDWITSFGHTNAPDDWTHRSVHDETVLDYLLRGDFFIGYDLAAQENMTFAVGGGLKYTDVQWTAYGGEFLYSVGTFRDTSFTLADSVKGITYRQSIPAFYVGADFETTLDEWSFAVSAHAGLAVFAKADDDHWLRNLKFVDRFDSTTPIIALRANVTYAVDDNMSVLMSLGYDKMYTVRGNTDLTNTLTNITTKYTDSAGMDLETLTASIGVSTKF